MTSGKSSRCYPPDERKIERKISREKILVFQQNGSGERKIQGIRRYGKERFIIETVSIDEALPPILDDTRDYLPSNIQADLVLDFLKHLDLSHDLAVACRAGSIPIIASGKKLRVKGALTPPTWCGLSRQVGLGQYGEHFGAPEFAVEITNGKIDRIQVCRGAPCGATWDAAKRIEGLPVEEAEVRIGLETQYFCSADPSGWDPIHGKSPVHFAGDVHIAALKKALQKEKS
jgi:hypothetical protein